MIDYRDWKCIIHHSAARRSAGADQIETWHLGRNFSEIGYTWVIENDGRVVAGRSVRKNGAHARGHNAKSVGICVVGDNTKVRHCWTDVQIASLKRTVEAVRLLFPGIQVVGHRDLAVTECPGLDVNDLLAFGERHA